MSLRLMENHAPETETDAEILVRTREGDTDSFPILYRRYARSLFFYAQSMTRDSALAEDFVQEAFSKLLAYDPADIEDSAKGLLYSFTRNLAIDEARRSSLRHRKAPRLLPAAGTPPVSRELAEAVSRALDELPDEQREAVILKVYAGMTFEEAAAVAEAPTPTVMSRYRYALQKLSELLQDE